jgi:uncharacterized protein YndB with AHSA1/START domain
MHVQFIRSLIAGCVLPCAAAHTDVVESSAAAMQIRHVIPIAAPVGHVYQAFLQIGSWWDKDHTFSGNAANLKLTASPGGCFCETLPDGGGVQHLTVVYVAPNERITLSGALGPLQTTGVVGAMSFSFVPKASGMELVMIYNVGGYYPNGLQSVAGDVNDVLLHQLQRLKSLAETGKADRPAAKPTAD